MSMKFERDERKFDFHDIGCKIRIRDGSASSNASCQGAPPLPPCYYPFTVKYGVKKPICTKIRSIPAILQ